MFLYKLQNNELNFTPLFETQLRIAISSIWSSYAIMYIYEFTLTLSPKFTPLEG